MHTILFIDSTQLDNGVLLCVYLDIKLKKSERKVLLSLSFVSLHSETHGFFSSVSVCVGILFSFIYMYTPEKIHILAFLKLKDYHQSQISLMEKLCNAIVKSQLQYEDTHHNAVE